ncbi:DUF4395 domain-containing protein [Deinococcus sp. KNUC1210]|uniref:DUF4395 domain-containing protein n=1 Tax=Deinococcus sp. KNUC1210 TaxID=2917691 RepID=UPI001EF00328|nr:DUF4395 domain-containing protein [Deinococcus sp. KNUC1210]ULH16438.1 DUF4395 domain-containing protein [Deinococcus sp. KNUC1210]
MNKTDLNALKFNQLTVVGVTAVAVVASQPWLAGLLGAAMLIGAVSPTRSPMRAAYRAVGPRLGLNPDIVEESPEAHLFAQGVGGVFLLASALSGLAGLGVLSAVLGLTVIALALLNLTARICVGCLMYFQWRMLKYRVGMRN